MSRSRREDSLGPQIAEALSAVNDSDRASQLRASVIEAPQPHRVFKSSGVLMPDEQEYSLEQVLDHAKIGNEPSPEYIRAVSVLDNVVRECIFVSRSYAGIPAPSGKPFYASVLFTALITRAVSLVNLAPFSPWSKKLIEHWDYATAANIARTMLELRIAYYYLCAEECPQTEWECRWNIFNLHDCNSRIRLFEASAGDVATEVAGFQQEAEELRDRLRANEFFATLQPKQQKRYLHGRDAYLFSLEEIAEKAGVDRSTFRLLYVLFSAHVHGLPMSFYRMGHEGTDRGRGLPSPVEEGYTKLCLSLASTVLVKTRDEMRELFKAFGHREAASAERPTVDRDDPVHSAERLPVGGSINVVEIENIRITVARVSEEVSEISYFHPRTNELVLKTRESEAEGSSLEFFEPLFWNLLVNGGPATPSAVAELANKRWAFRINVDTRTLHINVDLDQVGPMLEAQPANE